jgi:hypothetical protein
MLIHEHERHALRRTFASARASLASSPRLRVDLHPWITSRCDGKPGGNSVFIHRTKGEGRMHDSSVNTFFTVLKALSYVALAAMAGAIVYAAVMALRYWPGIAV